MEVNKAPIITDNIAAYTCLIDMMFFICILLSGIKIVVTSNDVMAHIVADIISSYDMATSILSHSCTSNRFEMSLLRLLSYKEKNKFIQNVSENRTQDVEENGNLLIIVNLNCPGVRNFMEKSADRNMFSSPYRWILMNGTEEDEIPTVISDLYFPPASEILYFTNKTIKDAYEIRMIYRVGSDSEWIKETFGYWHPRGLQRVMTGVTVIRRRNLRGYELKVGYILTDNNSLAHLTDKRDSHVDVLTKANYQTMNFLIDFLNASSKYVFVPSERYVENVTWNALLGPLATGDIDAGGTPMFMTSERLSTVTYIASPLQTRAMFVFQQPSLSYNSNIFLLSFDASLWYGSAILMCLISMMLLIVTVWEWKKMDHKMSEENNVLRPNIIDIILLIFGATCQQGSTVELKGGSGRLVFILVFMTVTFLYTSFSANIVGLLQSRSTQIRTVQDLLLSGLKLAVEDTDHNRYHFAMETETVRRKLYKSKIATSGEKPNFMDLEEGVKELKKGLFAFHMDTGTGYKLVGKFFEENEKCGFYEIPFLPVVHRSIAVNKKSAYAEMFKIGLKRIEEHGLQRRENLLLYQRMPKCEGNQANFVTVGMVECSSAFFVLLYGMLISALICCVENIIHKYDLKRTLCEINLRRVVSFMHR